MGLISRLPMTAIAYYSPAQAQANLALVQTPRARYRDDLERAQEAVLRLQKDLTEHRESLPPSHTPVSRLFDESEEETQELK